MILMLHILIALSSVGYTTYLLITPSAAGLRRAYALVGLTLASGLYLVATTPGHILQTCLTGLVYVGAVTAGLAAARHKLAAAKVTVSR